jgi:hypothetical protein
LSILRRAQIYSDLVVQLVPVVRECPGLSQQEYVLEDPVTAVSGVRLACTLANATGIRPELHEKRAVCAYCG